MHAVRTCKCKLFRFVQTGIRIVPQNHLYEAHSRCTAIFVTCVTCVPTYSSRSGFEMLMFREERK